MNDRPADSIRIYPPGTRVTDNAKAQALAAMAPASFRKAQDVLVAARKYAHKSGLFTTERSRIKTLQTECYEMIRALGFDQFMSEEMERKGEEFVFIEFFSLFSDAFPNWQKEYDALNRFVPLVF